MSAVAPNVSVVVRNRNEEHHLENVLAALRRQSLPVEIIVVDNESTDGSQVVAKNHGARIVNISRQEFTYGKALNDGMRAATGEIVINMSAHALPLGSRFIEQLVSEFSDPLAGGVRCEDIGYIDQHFNWMKRHELQWPVTWDDVWQHGLVNTCCAIRRSAWERIPYDESLDAAEDSLWTYQALQAGYTIRSSDCYYWYTRRRSLLQWIEAVNRTMAGQYRIAHNCSQKIVLHDVLSYLFFRGPKLYLRSSIELVGRYCSVRFARRRSTFETERGSLR